MGMIHWDSKPVDAETLARVLNVTANGALGEVSTTIRQGVGFACVSGHDDKHRESLLWDANRKLLIVADLRLFNAEDVARRLGVQKSQEPKLELKLLLTGYERWGERLLDYVDGEYAFVIWDDQKKKLFAARDPFGTKSLFYVTDASRFMFGSEPKQILVMPGVPVEPDRIVVGEFLFNNFQELERTFFSKVKRLKPGHFLLATSEKVGQFRYWDPDPQKQFYLSHPSEYLERFRELFDQAVAKRLHSNHSIAAQLSGGMDSTSIVVSAGKIFREKAENTGLFETLSGSFPGLECDESSYIDAVCRQIPFKNHRLKPLSENITENLDEEYWWCDSPMADLQRGLFEQCANVLAASQTHLLLTGIGGDEVAHEEYYLRDIAKSHQFYALIKEAFLLSRNSWNSYWYLLSDALRSSFPAGLKNFYRKFNPPKQWIPPEWINPKYVMEYNRFPAAEVYPNNTYSSFTQELVVRSVTHPHLCWGLEGVRARYLHHGVDVSHPFLDRELVEFTMQIPVEKRKPNGRWKYLLRNTFHGDLPPEILNRRRKTRFDSYNRSVLIQHKSVLEQKLYAGEDWKSEEFISREGAYQHFQSFSDDKLKDINFVTDTWKITCLELWLRQLPRYTLNYRVNRVI